MLLGNGFQIFAVVCFSRLWEHHWPNNDQLESILIGWLVYRAFYSYQEIVGLLERQNALLERLVERAHREG